MTEDEEYKSKSQVKREMHELQALGEKLADLPDSVRNRLELPENLESAISDYRRFSSRGARKRQLQFIGKVMRDTDADEIEHMLAQLQYQPLTDQREQEQHETLGNVLLHNENAALNLLIEHCPDLDIQQLRQLLRQCRKEQEGKEIYALNTSATGQKLLALLKSLDLDKELLGKTDW